MFPVENKNVERNGKVKSINTSLHGWCYCQNFEFFDSEMANRAYWACRVSLCSKEEEGPWGKLAGLTGMAFQLGLKGKGNCSKPVCDKVLDSITRLDGQGASRG